MFTEERITSRQLAGMVIFNVLGFGIFFIPAASAVVARQDAWLSFILATVIALGMAWFFAKVMSRFPGHTFYEIAESALGRWLSRALCLFVIGYFFLVTSYMLREFGELLLVTVMPETPIIVFIGLMSILVAVSAKAGVEVLARTIDFLLPIYIVFIVAAVFLAAKDFSPSNLLPVGETGLLGIGAGAVPALAFLAKNSVFLILGASLNRPQKIARGVLGGLALAGFLLIASEAVLIMLFGPALTASSTFPLFELARYISLGNFIERLDSVTMLIWVIGNYCNISIFFYVSLTGLAWLFGLHDYRSLVWPLVSILNVLAVSQFDSIIDINIFGGLGAYPFFAITILIILPLMILTIALVKKIIAKTN